MRERAGGSCEVAMVRDWRGYREIQAKLGWSLDQSRKVCCWYLRWLLTAQVRDGHAPSEYTSTLSIWGGLGMIYVVGPYSFRFREDVSISLKLAQHARSLSRLIAGVEGWATGRSGVWIQQHQMPGPVPLFIALYLGENFPPDAGRVKKTRRG